MQALIRHGRQAGGLVLLYGSGELIKQFSYPSSLLMTFSLAHNTLLTMVEDNQYRRTYGRLVGTIRYIVGMP